MGQTCCTDETVDRSTIFPMTNQTGVGVGAGVYQTDYNVKRTP